MKNKVRKRVLQIGGFFALLTMMSAEAGLFSRKANTPVPTEPVGASETEDKELTEFEKLQRAFSFFREERDKLNERLEIEQSERKVAEGQVARLRAELEKSQSDVLILKERLKDISGGEVDLDQATQFEEMKRRFLSSQGELQQARKQQGEQEAALKEARQHVLKLRAEVGALETELTKVREQLAMAREKKAEGDEVDRMRVEMASLEQQVAEANRALTQGRARQAEQQTELTRLAMALREKDAELEAARAQATMVERVVVPEPAVARVAVLEEEQVVDVEAAGPTEAEKKKAGNYVVDGNRLLAAGHIGKARGKFERALKLDGLQPGALLGMAACAYFEGSVDSASEKVETLLASYPEHVDGLGLKGIITWRQGDEKRAMDILEMAINLDNNNAQLHNYIGIVKHAGGDLPRAAEEFIKAVELDPDHIEAQFNLAVVLATYEPPRLQEAKKYYENALRLGSDRNEVLEEILYP